MLCGFFNEEFRQKQVVLAQKTHQQKVLATTYNDTVLETRMDKVGILSVSLQERCTENLPHLKICDQAKVLSLKSIFFSCRGVCQL